MNYMHTKSLRPAVFLDRDGTIIEERSYITRPDQVQLLPGAAMAIFTLRQAGYLCVVVTNQSAVGKGMITLAQLGHIHVEMLRQLREARTELDGTYFCPFSPTATDQTLTDQTLSEHPDRKPAPGMLLKAADELSLDLRASWMVGDRLSDVLAGRNAGCRESILVRTGYDVADTLSRLSDCHVEDDLLTVAHFILRNRNQDTARAA
jgi:D-glycero-D-manno-heptose 1,7-bisphosphate phosphatase